MTWLSPYTAPATLPAWQLFTRLGEAQILLPAAALVGLSLLGRPAGRALVLRWWGWLAGAVLLTTTSKLAFIGWGLGSARWDFTGISGHAMFSAAIYPVLLAVLWPPRWSKARSAGAWVGAALAVAVSVSRVVVEAHSVSEAVAGTLVGAGAGAVAWRLGTLRSGLAVWLPPLIALWLLATPVVAPPSRTHSMVTRWALALSGHAQPCTRVQLHRPGGTAGGCAAGGVQGPDI